MPVYPFGYSIVSGKQDGGTFVSNTINTYDSDAQAYFTQAGVTDATQKANINAFIVGLKAQSLWTSGRFFTYRNNQNAGTGTTAYGFGGLNSNNGTLTNGPTWGSDGLAMATASNHYIALGAFGTVFSGGIFCGSVHSVTSVAAATRALDFGQAPTGLGGMWAPFSDGNAYWDCLNSAGGRTSGASGMSNNTFAMMSGTSAGSGRVLRNSTSIASGGGTTGLGVNFDTVQVGRAGATVGLFNGTLTFTFIVATGSVGTTEQAAFYNLYKTTIGQGLSLP